MRPEEREQQIDDSVQPAGITEAGYANQGSIAIVGVRGAGKRTIGFICAAILRFRFVSEAVYFEQVTGKTKAKFLQEHGQDAYSDRYHQVFEQMLAANATECVIDCGMASLDGRCRSTLREFAKTRYVTHVMRDLDQVCRVLNLSLEDGRRLQEADAASRSCTNFVLYNLQDTTNDTLDDNDRGADFRQSLALRGLQADLARLLGRRLDSPAGPFSVSLPLKYRARSYAVHVNLSVLAGKSPQEWNFDPCVDVVELVVDKLVDDLSRTVSRCVASIRRHCRLPILYRVAADVAGSDRPTEETYLELLECGLRTSLDFVLVDLEASDHVFDFVHSRKHRAKVLGGCHFRDDFGWKHPTRLEMVQRGCSLRLDAVRLTQYAHKRSDNLDVQFFRAMIAGVDTDGMIVMAFNLGPLGRSSLLSNRILSPVRSDSDATCSETISVKEATVGLFASFEFDPLTFYVVGSDPTYSRSPVFHNAGYQAHGLRHTFVAQAVPSVEKVFELWSAWDFGGSSLSWPYKDRKEIWDACAHKSSHAIAIGAVNMVLPLRLTASLPEEAANRNCGGEVRALYGDNTDWCGFYVPVKRKLSPRNFAHVSSSTGLVLGCGGSGRAAVYALLRMGYGNVVVMACSLASAEAVAAHFNAWAATERGLSTNPVQAFSLTHRPWPQTLTLPSTIIACMPPRDAAQGYDFPDEWLHSATGGVVAEVNYKPRVNPFLQQVQRVRAKTGFPWAIVDGLEVLLEQGINSFEIMTGRPAPRKIMTDAIYDQGQGMW